MAIRETPTHDKNKVIRIAEKVKAIKFSAGPEYKFVFRIESTTSRNWRAYFADSLPEEARYLLEEVKQERRARFLPVYFHRSELDIICIPSELSSILDIVQSAIQLANEKDANHHALLAEAQRKKEQAWRLAHEEEHKADKNIQKFFAKLKL